MAVPNDIFSLNKMTSNKEKVCPDSFAWNVEFIADMNLQFEI